MKAKRIIYSRLISKGNYENAKIELEMEVEDGEKASDVFNLAKEFVEKRIEREKISDFSIRLANEILSDKEMYTHDRIIEAEELLASSKDDDHELPF